MQRLRLIHWNATEALERAAQLRTLGYEVDAEPFDGAGLRRLRDNPPDAVVIDLSRRPCGPGRFQGLLDRRHVDRAALFSARKMNCLQGLHPERRSQAQQDQEEGRRPILPDGKPAPGSYAT